MIIHSVILTFKENAKKQDFFEAANKLANIEGVKNFKLLKEISPKNKFEYGISMEFDNQEQYDYYTNHAEHQNFIQNFWMNSVEDFLEIDYTGLH